MMIRSVLNYFRRDKGVTAMFVVLIFVLVLATLGPKGVEDEISPADDIYSLESRVETTQQIQELSERMVEDLSENPTLVLISLTFSLIVVLGLVLDLILILFGREWIQKRMQVNPDRQVLWTLGDLFKVFVILFFAEIVLSILIGIFLGIFQWEDDSSSMVLMGSTFLRSIIVFLYICYMTRKKYMARLKDLGLVTRRWLKQIAIGLVAYICMLPLYILVLLVLTQIVQFFDYQPPVQTPVQVLYKEESMRLVLLFGVFMGIVGPFFEEVLFRGFLYQALRKRTGVLWGIVLTSVIFAVLHVHWIALFPIFLLGVILNLLFEKTGSILPGVVMHMTHNMVMLMITLQLKDMLG